MPTVFHSACLLHICANQTLHFHRSVWWTPSMQHTECRFVKVCPSYISHSNKQKQKKHFNQTKTNHLPPPSNHPCHPPPPLPQLTAQSNMWCRAANIHFSKKWKSAQKYLLQHQFQCGFIARCGGDVLNLLLVLENLSQPGSPLVIVNNFLNELSTQCIHFVR